MNNDDPVVQKALGIARQLTPQGLYSHGAETAAALPQAKGTPQQMQAMLVARGVKPEEMKWSGVQNAFSGQQSITKNQLSHQFQQGMPDIHETVLSNKTGMPPRHADHQLPGASTFDPDKVNQHIEDKAISYALESGDIDHKREWPEASNDVRNWHINEAKKNFHEQMATDPSFKEQFVNSAPGGGNYREILLHTPKIAQHNQTYYPPSSHYDQNNLLGHIRVSDRDAGDTLHLEELQSDWGQQARKAGVSKPYDANEIQLIHPENILDEKHKNDFWNFKTSTGATRLPKNRYPTVKDAIHHLTTQPVSMGVPPAPYIEKTENWTDLLLKRALKEAAEGKYKRMVWSNGPIQESRWPGSNLSTFYDQMLPKRLQEVVKRLGHKAILEHHAIDTGDKSVTLPSIRMTPELRDSILKGMPAYAQGGMIDDPAKAIRRATLIAKGLSRAIGPLPSKDEGERVHPASMVPGVHVQALAAGGEVEPTDETGFDAWHGTPHRFEPEPGAPLGRFRSDKIGTGEGAQAFGHGLYLGEEKTARGYRDRLKGGPGGATIFQTILQHYNNEKDIPVSASDAVQPFVGKGPEAIKNALIQQAKKMQKSSWDSKRDDAKKIEELAADNDLHEKLNELGGHIYHVRVNANPEHFLDWDKPLGEQHPLVRQALSTFNVRDRDYVTHPGYKGETAYRAISWEHGQDPAKASAALHAAGIPGIRYLDANSRGPTGNPTHNHVIFDPSIIDIKRRYKRGGGVGLPHKSDGGMLSGQKTGEDYATQTAAGSGQNGPEAGRLREPGGLRGSQGVLPAPGEASGEAPLEGLPRKIKVPRTGATIVAGPDPRIRAIAAHYVQSMGMRYNPPIRYAKADEERGKRISDAYEAMPHDPHHPLVKASYEALARETMAQYEAAKRAGFKAEFWHPEKQTDPYADSPRYAVEDVRNNHHMYVFPTHFGYGSEPGVEGANENPLLRDSGERWNGHTVLVNDVFRAIHDYYGHAKEGVGFRSDGEENAWRSHAAMFSPLARLALGTETRGQNSWLNFGPHGKANRNASTEDTVFAPPKIGILPHWVHHEGAEDFMLPEDIHAMGQAYLQHRRNGGQVVGEKIINHALKIARKSKNYGGSMGSPEGTLGVSKTPDVTFMGKQPHEFSPEDWHNFGRQYGVPTLGPSKASLWQKSLQPITTTSGRKVTIPGGVDNPAPFSYYDLLHLKSQAVDPNDLDPEVHQKIHNRMVSAMQPGKGGPSTTQIANQMIFGLISPNQPLTPNELALQRTMVKGPKDLQTLGEMIPYSYKDEIPDIGQRQTFSRKITPALGLQAAERGGLGASGSANYADIAEFAQKIKDRPDFFAFNPDTTPGESPSEKWSNHVSKILNEIRGLKAKTASLGTVWQSPKDAAISAIDRHMATILRNNVFRDNSEQNDWEHKTIGAFNDSRPDQLPAKSIDEMVSMPGGRGHFVDKILQHVNNLPSVKTRSGKTGEYNPRVPEALRDVNWVKGEPKQLELIEGPYVRALEENQRRAEQAGQGLFSNQWMLWDRIRRRLEPHEIMYPGLENLPRMSLEQMKRVMADLNKSGYLAASGTVRPMPSASHAGYFERGGDVIDHALSVVSSHKPHRR